MTTQTKGPLCLAAILAISICFAVHADPQPFRPFLDATVTMDCKTSTDCDNLAKKYYEYFGVYNAQGQPNPAALSRGTITQWRALHGFSPDPKTLATGEVRFSYYNGGDLRIGRDMHCRVYQKSLPPPLISGLENVLACYVTNYGDGTFSFEADDTDNTDKSQAYTNAVSVSTVPATAGKAGNPIATVVMEAGYSILSKSEPEVWFAAYNAAGKPVTSAALDDYNGGQNKQAIPGICLSCHGGSWARSWQLGECCQR